MHDRFWILQIYRYVGDIQQFPTWEMPIQWENGLGGLGGYKRIFFDFFA
jgi:hypothetical protein